MAMRGIYKRQFFKDIIQSRHQPPGPFPLVLVLDRMKATFNIGKIVRTANAMGLRELHFVGIPLFHPKPCKGTLRQTRSRSFDNFDESYASLVAEGYTLFALDPNGEETLGLTDLPELSAFVIGHEEFGLSFDPTRYDRIKRVRIAQFGAVQSLNASIAASVACFEYLRQRGFDPKTVSSEHVSRFYESASESRNLAADAARAEGATASLPDESAAAEIPQAHGAADVWKVMADGSNVGWNVLVPEI